ncbi:FMN-binding protein [Mycoplasmatota bacterium]|nr:FMN-binding protein [Mycoplasmatota bacterium]
MKNKLLIGLKLFVIAALSGLALYGVNELTEDTIIENRIKREEAKYALIFPDYYRNEKTPDEGITQIAIYDEEDNLLGYIYSAGANNDYGSITVLVGVNDMNEIVKVEFASLNQTPSYASKVNNDSFLGRFVGNSTSDSYLDFDVKVGATYSATTTRDLVEFISKYHEGVE